MASLQYYADNFGSGPKMGHLSWEAAHRDGYSNQAIINWINQDTANRKSPNAYNDMQKLQNRINQNTLNGDINVSYMNILAREADGPGLQNKKKSWERDYMMSNQGGSDSSKANFAYGELGQGLRSSPEARNTQELARRAYVLYLGRPHETSADLNQSVADIIWS